MSLILLFSWTRFP